MRGQYLAGSDQWEWSPVPETLAQREAWGDGKPDGALLEGEGEEGGEYEDPDQVELELCPSPGAGHHGAGAHSAGSQHGPVEEGEELWAEVLHHDQHYQLSLEHWVISSGGDCTPGTGYYSNTGWSCLLCLLPPLSSQ